MFARKQDVVVRVDDTVWEVQVKSHYGSVVAAETVRTVDVAVGTMNRMQEAHPEHDVVAVRC